ncbi:putative bifunctional diguanylate cyclase/phosphodiesterase [Couchioplanes caeruleus]|uniref:Diguanylate cyclase n=3 Tax=Couchioplanes caeruleus TaxID=56438 RepID=A0A1K0FP52_9ACTN|nr:EAL domain-containing protein [Couchioplanes caeruleus]OJF14623.1 diguanylate cyclase [Couchioplanes caeruleus subsp. caeruleus]ROP34212.1 diguanylate cyclase (GGDEF)-like protein [Couchioplanes caeruleus]
MFGGAGAVATVLYTLDLSPSVNGAAFALIGLGAVLACATVPLRSPVRPRAAWPIMGVAALFFLVGVIVRPYVTDQPLLADAATVPGYALLATFFALLLRARGGVTRHAVLDGLIVCLAGGLASALLLASPAAEIADRPAIVSFLAGLYPLFDVVLLALGVNLTFTARTWPPSLVALVCGIALMVVGDLAYAVIGVSGLTYASPLFDAPFLLSYTLIGISALHPSVVELVRADRQPVQAWSWRRMSLLVPAVVTPFVLLVAVGGRSGGHRALLAAGGLAIVTLLMLRAVTAVQAQVAAQLHSEYQSMHDPLTGLPNRRMATAEIERLVSAPSTAADGRVWVCVLDLDGFKWVNDSWGHDTGDQLVIEVATRLRAALPAGTTLARVGGDEFVAAHVGEETEALRLVERVQSCFATPLPLHDTKVVISASLGLAHAPGGGDPALTAEALLRDADTAMYRSKSEGPGHATIFDVSMHDRVRERIELEGALRAALAEGGLTVVYQPIVRLDTGRPTGAEALVRWNHPERGPIPPMTFIPVAEEAGLIDALGTWVRNEALGQLARWRADGTVTDDFYLSINVSPRQLEDPHLPAVVTRELQQHGVPASAVALEMTESVMADGGGVAGRVLFELRELGLRLLVDDFGTGFSALGYLRRFPVTGVKIDRSFVSGLGESGEDEEIVRAVVAMSRALGLSIVAEGVETRTQRDALAAVGVVQGQGWLWGPGVSAGDFALHWAADRHVPGPAPLGAGNA